jgi:hypothetical protein
LHGRLRRDGENICAAFGVALESQLATLATEVSRLPLGFVPGDADQLDPAQFESWTRTRDALAVVESARSALNFAYPKADAFPTPEALGACRFTRPADAFADPAHADRYARALGGTRIGGSELGPVNHHAVFAPSGC